MLYDEIRKTRPWVTLLTFKVGDGEAVLSGAHPMGKEPVTQTIILDRPVCKKDGVVMVPAKLFEEGMFTYLTIENGVVAIERAG